MSVKNQHEHREHLFSVVINHDAQYSIWPLGKEIPSGWQKEGKVGSKSDCLEYINNVWTDIRPQSVMSNKG